MKLSPTQSRVLVVLAEGGSLTRHRLGADTWHNLQRAAGDLRESPRSATVARLAGLGLIETTVIRWNSCEWAISAAGRAALEAQP